MKALLENRETLSPTVYGVIFFGTILSIVVIAYLLGQIGDVRSAVMVGDTAFDVLGAAAHGISTIGVSWGYGEVADMKEAGAIAIAHSMEELVALLNQ